MMSHFIMLERNLIYTGVTRAKKLMVIAGDTKALAYAIKNVKADVRNTKLEKRIREAIEDAKSGSPFNIDKGSIDSGEY